jgi:hypothetical protein
VLAPMGHYVLSEHEQSPCGSSLWAADQTKALSLRSHGSKRDEEINAQTKSFEFHCALCMNEMSADTFSRSAKCGLRYTIESDPNGQR